MQPSARTTSTSTVGFPRESRTSRARMASMAVIDAKSYRDQAVLPGREVAQRVPGRLRPWLRPVLDDAGKPEPERHAVERREGAVQAAGPPAPRKRDAGEQGGDREHAEGAHDRRCQGQA